MTEGTRLQVDNVKVEYEGKLALAGVDVEVRAGEIVAIIGANGAGKSTLLNAIMGLAPITGGDVRLDGNSIKSLRTSAKVRLGIGYFPQGAPVFVELTVLQNLSIAGSHLGGVRLGPQIDQALELFPALRNRLAQRAGVLSGGEKQMLGLARVFIGQPRLLLLDEPSSGLHPHVRSALFTRIRELSSRQGTCQLIVEQNIPDVVEVSSRVYALKRGQVVASGNAKDFSSKEKLRQILME